MKKKVLLSSIMTIALCLCLIAGSTFALFTSKSQVNIAVTAGKVDMTAGIAVTKLESVKADDTLDPDADGTIVDENGATYFYKNVTAKGQFTNGGTAVVDGATLTLDKVTPGDKVTFQISGTNDSDVAIQYRYIIECVGGYKLMDGLVVAVNNDAYTSLASYTSAWASLAVGTDIKPVTVSIELPVTAGNEYQEQTTEIKVIVEAVQGNAAVEDNTDPIIVEIPKVTDATELANALADPEIPAINILDDIAKTIVVDYDLSNKTIWANGNDVSFVFNGKVENVVISGIKNDADSCSVDVSGATGDITVLDSEFKSATGGSAPSIYVGANVNVTVDNCTFEKGAGKGYGIRGNASKNLTVTNCEFYNYSSWAIIVNGKADGDVIVDGCYFKTGAGVFKTLSDGITGDFTFTNNTMIAPGDNENINYVVVSGSNNGPIICAGEVTSENNTLNEAAWEVAWTVPVANND